MLNKLFLIMIMINLIVLAYFYSKRRDLKPEIAKAAKSVKNTNREMDKLMRLRSIRLTKPLAELTRPSTLEEVIGQENGIRALKAAICSANPQHVIIYGPPGIGKTAAARLILELAKQTPDSPFRQDARFVEIDATTVRFDERGIADPLIGTVHDPIYQGAGAMGSQGVPQPKPGAVTKAHGGILFIDEIGELHPIQMNKLLKVLEDRVVYLESAYYNPDDPKTPVHIHDIFQNGLPADFRLIGATTRGPESIPPALRSRCMEIYFRPLNQKEIETICENTAAKIDFPICREAVELVAKYASNGRETVNIFQMAMGVCLGDHKDEITVEDIEWVVNCSQYTPRMDKKIKSESMVGAVNGLAVFGNNVGTILEIEADAYPVPKGTGHFTVTGIVEEEEIDASGGHTMRRKSMARGSVENVLTALRTCFDIEAEDYHIHVNFPGGIPIDGPSAGVSMASAIYSAITNIPVENTVAMTGEISICGKVMPVGGVSAKIEAAICAGAKTVLIPQENWQESYRDYFVQVIPIAHLKEVLRYALVQKQNDEQIHIVAPTAAEILSADSI